jgi:hypothetical protein
MDDAIIFSFHQDDVRVPWIASLLTSVILYNFNYGSVSSM